MDAKDLIKNKSMCVLPWTGFELEPTGEVKNCIMSKQFIGDINKSHIKDIVNGKANIDIKRDMLKDTLVVWGGDSRRLTNLSIENVRL